jgi:hypothetical protein
MCVHLPLDLAIKSSLAKAGTIYEAVESGCNNLAAEAAAAATAAAAI